MRISIRSSHARRTLVEAAAVALGLAVAVGTAGAAGATTGPRATAPAHRLVERQAATPRPSVHPAPSAAARTADPARRRAVAHRIEPRTVAPAATFVVTSLADSPLASPSGTHCRDAESAHPCSLRAAVQAANNLDRPVVIKLGAHTYSLTDAGLASLEIANAGGTTIDGVSEGATKIRVPSGDHYSVLYVVESVGSKGSTVFLNDLTLTGGNAATGGGLDEEDVGNIAAVLDHVSITGNTAVYSTTDTGEGGGVFVEYGSLWATDSSISGNTSQYQGGGLWDYWGYVYLLRTAVNADLAVGSSTDEGGGTYSDYGDVHVVGGSVSGDRAGDASEAGYGGGVYDYEGTSYLSGGVQVNHDDVQDGGDGGADYEEYSTLNVDGATFSYDQALGGTDNVGGAIAIETFDNSTVTSATFSHDSTSDTTLGDGGGAIFDYGEGYSSLLTVAGSSFTSDTTTAIVLYAYDGGASAVFTGCLLQGNKTSIAGGAGAMFAYVDEYGGLSVKIDGSKLLGNTAGGAGSAGAISVYSEDYSGSTLTMSGDTVSGNTATGNEGTGGIRTDAASESSVSLDVAGSTFRANHAPDEGYGGAISTTSNEEYENSTLRLAGDQFVANTAGSSADGHEGYGGAVLTYDYTQLQVDGSTFTGNVANGTGAAAGDGGAVYDGSESGSSYVGDTFRSNRATGSDSSGGALYLYPYYGGALLAQDTITGNAAQYGGGAYVYYYTLDVVNSTIADNTAGSVHAAGAGGGLYVAYDAVSVTNSTLTGNVAMSSGATKGQGGAVYFAEGGSQVYFFDTIVGNAAAQGAGLYVDSDPGSVRGSIVTRNFATLHGGAEEDCFAKGARLSSAGGNVFRTSSCVSVLTTGDVVTAQPGLGALAHNGGPTETMALLAHSPALGAVATGCTPTDQRGVHRPVTGCDAGAYELAPAAHH